MSPGLAIDHHHLRGEAEARVDRRVGDVRVAELLRPVDDVLALVVDARRASGGQRRGARLAHRAGGHQRAARAGRLAEAELAGGVDDHVDAVGLDAELLGGHLQRDRVHALAHLGPAVAHLDPAGHAVGVGVEAHDRPATPRGSRCRARSSSGRARARPPCRRRSPRRRTALISSRHASAPPAPSSMIWPGPHSSPGRITLRLRISHPLMPTCSASRSSTPSSANWAWLAPNPRNAPHTRLLVRTAIVSTSSACPAIGAAGVAGGPFEHLHPDAGVRAGVADAAHLAAR